MSLDHVQHEVKHQNVIISTIIILSHSFVGSCAPKNGQIFLSHSFLSFSSYTVSLKHFLFTLTASIALCTDSSVTVMGFSSTSLTGCPELDFLHD